MSCAARRSCLDGLFTIRFGQIPVEDFQDLPAEIRSERFFRVNELTNAYVDAVARDVAAEMGPGAQVAADRRAVGSWIERKLASRSGLPPSPPTSNLRAAILDEEPNLRAALDLIDRARDGYPAFLRGERTGSSILFDPGSPGLWDDYFSNENPAYSAGNVLASHAAALALDQRDERHRGGAGLRVLEVGAGCGSAAEALISRLAGRIESYQLTDTSPAFLRRARERVELLEASLPIERSYGLLDLNRPASTWRVRPGETDLVYAVNVLHAVRDVVVSLSGLRELLAPGGCLVLGECIRPARGVPVHPELVFLLLEEFRNVALDPVLRPEPGFLDETSWRAALQRAGFDRVRFVPDFVRAVAAYPAHSLGAIVAWRR